MKPNKGMLIISLTILVILLTLPLYASGYIVSLLVTILMYAILAMSWNILSGYTGYVSLGTAVFFGIGIYATVIGWSAGLPYPLLIVLGGLASTIFALLIGFPFLRIRGPYFVILTFGLSEAVKFIIEQVEVKTKGGMFGNVLVGGPSMETFYYSLIAICIIVVITDHIIRNSKFGLGLSSIKGNEEVAEAMGVDTTRYKLFAFATSALFMGFTGAVMALRWTYIVPSIAFNPMTSFQTMIMAILGGSADFRGPLLGTVVLTLISEAFGIRFPYHYMIILGITLILIIKFLPMGLLGAIMRLRMGKKQYGSLLSP